MTITEMREQRAREIGRMREVHEAAVSEGRALTAEENQEFDRLSESVRSLKATIDRDEELRGLTPKPEAREAARGGERETADLAEETGDRAIRQAYGFDTPEYRDAFSGYLRGGLNDLTREQRAALNTATDAEGGFWVPETWANRFIESLTQFGVIEANAEIIETATGAKLHIPGVVDADPVSGTGQNPQKIAELGTYTESEDTLDDRALDAFKYGHIVKVSDEMVVDSMFDIDSFVRRRAARAIALRTGNLFAVGSGTGEPRGIVTAAPVGKTFASATVIAADEIKGLYYSLRQPYRGNAKWVLNDLTAAALAVVKDNNGRYLLQDSLAAGESDTLMGKPVLTDPNIAEAAINAKTVVFGDLSTYAVRRVGTVSIKVLDQRYADDGQIGYRVDIRTDGDLLDTAGVVVGQQAAA